MATTTFKELDLITPTSFYCGLDVHKHQLAVAVYGKDDSNTEILKYNVYSTDTQGLKQFWKFISPYNPKGFVMEATGIYHHTIALFLRQQIDTNNLDAEIYIVNPADASGIPNRQKTDRVDAEQLAKYYAYGLFKNGKPLIPVLEDLKALFRMNARLEVDRTALKNRIKKTLDRAGFRIQSFDLNKEWTNEFLFAFVHQTQTVDVFIANILKDHTESKFKNQLMTHIDSFKPYLDISLSSAQRILILQDLYDLDLKTTRQTLIRVEIEKALQSRLVLRDMAYNLSTIPGISNYSAVWILAELGGIARFHTIRQFLSYCGLVPRIVSSADKIYSAHLNRHSNKYLRGIFYQAAIVVSNVVKKESDLKRYADRMKWLKQNRVKVAYCTTAAKIAHICFGILHSNTPFKENNKNVNNSTSTTSNKRYSIVELKELKRAKRVLQRIRNLNGMESIEPDIEGLVCSLEEILAKK